MPNGFTIGKTVALVLALAKLHNFCIDEKDLLDDDDNRKNHHEDHTPAVSAIMANQTLFTLEATHQGVHGIGNAVPLALLDGGQHSNDITRSRRANEVVNLPRDQMLTWVIHSGKTRPSVGYDGEIVFM
jgi:hypothetical protein